MFVFPSDPDVYLNTPLNPLPSSLSIYLYHHYHQYTERNSTRTCILIVSWASTKNSILCLPQLAGKTLLDITVLFLLSLHISSSRSTTPHHTYTHTHLHTQIYNHTRHVQFNLMQLERKQVSPPFKPRLDSDRDLANFPIEFTGEPVQLTPDDE